MSYKQVSFLPWVKFKDIIRLGPITFWPYKEADQIINDSEIKKHLDRYFKSYVDHRGRPVDTITICSYGNVGFNILSDNEYQELRSAVDVLIFTSIAPQVERSVCNNNRSWAPPSSNAFELVTQNFQPEDDHITISVGSVLSGG